MPIEVHYAQPAWTNKGQCRAILIDRNLMHHKIEWHIQLQHLFKAIEVIENDNKRGENLTQNTSAQKGLLSKNPSLLYLEIIIL